ncbi:SDR family oxidoreductase [Actinoallomurus spadix]|uniref:SDR family oxidoreductase n=1 Tax=Actinoallomurus spadix TaxID=79912 RepID=UPI0020937B3F|nr:SDR family oxidoreductase [Actinoallomurus spadix]
MGTYLITGATGGIGAAVADLLYEAGQSLILVGRSAERLAETAARLGHPTPLAVEPTAHPSVEHRVRVLELDLSDPRRIEAALADAGLPPLDGVVHSAGVVELGRVAEAPPGAWVEQLLVNAAAPAELTRLLLPQLRAARGHVVFVNSGSGLRARGGWGAYAASKHALRALADALRDEEPDIRVTSVYPGRTASEMQRKVRDQEGGEYDPADYMSAPTVATVIVNALTTPRDATVTDISVRG